MKALYQGLLPLLQCSPLVRVDIMITHFVRKPAPCVQDAYVQDTFVEVQPGWPQVAAVCREGIAATSKVVLPHQSKEEEVHRAQ